MIHPLLTTLQNQVYKSMLSYWLSCTNSRFVVVVVLFCFFVEELRVSLFIVFFTRYMKLVLLPNHFRVVLDEYLSVCVFALFVWGLLVCQQIPRFRLIVNLFFKFNIGALLYCFAVGFVIGCFLRQANEIRAFVKPWWLWSGFGLIKGLFVFSPFPFHPVCPIPVFVHS